jgi:uncharacterized protein (TIGR02996 family)
VFEEYPAAAGFLAAIRATPDDPTPRLVFSDWLEERGDPRAPWLREPDLWPWMAPDLHDPLPALLAELQAEDRSRRHSATGLLLRLGPAASDVARHWIRENKDRHYQVDAIIRAVPPTNLRPVVDLVSILQTSTIWVEHWLAIIDLGHHGPAAGSAVGALIGLLEAADYEQATGGGADICRTLARIGQPAGEAIPTLIKLARGGLFESREAAEALGRLVPLCPDDFFAHPEWFTILRGFLIGQWNIPNIASTAARLLRQRRLAAEWLLNDLIEALRKPPSGDSHEIRYEIALTLVAIGEEARDAVPTLRKVLEEYDLFVPTGGFANAAREAIRTALAALDPG